MFGIFHDECLGNFEAQATLRKFSRGDDGADLVDKPASEQLAARNVDAHGEWRLGPLVGGVKALQVRNGHGDDRRSELHDEIGLFGQGHEFGGIEFTEARMFPPHERFIASNLLVPHGVDGLVLQRQLALLDSQAQIGFKYGALAAVGAQVRREREHGVAALAAGTMHGDLGIVEDAGGGCCRITIEDGESDRGGGRDLDAADFDQRAHGDAHAFGEHLQFLLGPLRQNENAELVGADAGQRLAGTDQMGQPAGERNQQTVGFKMLCRSGHGLKAVDVDDDDGRLDKRLALSADEGNTKPVEEQRAVGQARDRVVDRIVGEAFVRRLAVGGFADEAHAAHATAVGGWICRRLQHEPTVIVIDMTHAEFEAEVATTGFLEVI